jgi:hypothetical protein
MHTPQLLQFSLPGAVISGNSADQQSNPALALTVLQPWAEMIVRGLKTLETRGWTTTHRGRLLIHASKSTRGLNFVQGEGSLPLRTQLQSAGVELPSLRLGAVLGEVHLDGIRTLTQDDWRYPHAHGYLVDGPLVWMLSQAKKWDMAIPARGDTGLWWCALKPSSNHAAANSGRPWRKPQYPP